jgi:hypothetical protein
VTEGGAGLMFRSRRPRFRALEVHICALLMLEPPHPGDSAAIYFFVSLPSSTVFQVVPSGDISNLKL